MIDMDKVTDTIAEAGPIDLANMTAACISALGQYGRVGAEALLDRLDGDPDAYLDEGLAQILAVEGVRDGRTDEL